MQRLSYVEFILCPSMYKTYHKWKGKWYGNLNGYEMESESITPMLIDIDKYEFDIHVYPMTHIKL